MKTADWLHSEPWYEQDAYIVGGGSSLKDFDWSLLEKLNTIGCNDAYKLGQKVCKICMFGDLSWWRHHCEKMEIYKGIVVTNVGAIDGEYPPWVNQFDRLSHGLCKLDENRLGWNGNTGAAALNLALVLGAKNIYLLGFDMGIIDKETNWHNEIIHPKAVLPSSYEIFRYRWSDVVKDLHIFPNRNVFNVNNTSILAGTTTINVEEFWKGKT